MKSQLAEWQSNFVNTYLADRKSCSLLCAAPGTGKTITSLFTADKMVAEGHSEKVLVISDAAVLREQWKHVFRNFVGSSSGDGFDSVTIQSLSPHKRSKYFEEAKTKRYFIIADDFNFGAYEFPSFINGLSKSNDETKILLISTDAERVKKLLGDELLINSEYFFQPSIIRLPATRIQLFESSPSLSILEKLIKNHAKLDDISWRDFEKLISQLLEKDGYEIELTRGTKDGGVDVIATKDLGSVGLFRTIWQAKKKLAKNKVGLSIIRELADTRSEFNASKGIIVTNSFLTADALARVQRDRYVLGKVDRNDLNHWISKHFI